MNSPVGRIAPAQGLDEAGSLPVAPAQRLLHALRRSLRVMLGPDRSAPAAAAEQPAPTEAARRVLLVEAEAPVRAALSAALSGIGFAVVAATDSERAVSCLGEDMDGFDLLLAGPTAAREDGDLLVRTVRRGGEAELAVVMVTGGADAGAELERAGADAVLDGSLGAELIARASEAVLSRKRQRRRA